MKETTLPDTHLIRIQLTLVHGVGVLNDFNLVFSKTLPIETLREKLNIQTILVKYFFL